MTLCGALVNLRLVNTLQPEKSQSHSAFEPVEIVAGALDSGLILLCDHASNALPPEYGSLGLPPEQFERHIAWDIGAAAVTRALAARFGAPAVLTRFSRLLIDPNRGADDPTLLMKLSDGAIVPATSALTRRRSSAGARVSGVPIAKPQASSSTG